MDSNPNPTLPIAEVFTSIHGEGRWAGTPMTFIRLAGCTVGRVFYNNGPAPIDFPRITDGKYMFECTTFDGRHFPCDTDYRKTSAQTVDELIAQIPSHIRHVCVTGGEPLMHQENPAFIDLFHRLRRVCVMHIETSGTILPVGDWSLPEFTYITCSPKARYKPELLRVADEVRIMVDEDIDENLISKIFSETSAQIYFAPLSSSEDVNKFSETSMKKCLELLKLYPDAKISIQMHKVLGVR